MHASLHVMVGPSHVLQRRFPAPRPFVCFPPPSFDAFPTTFSPSSASSLSFLRLVSSVLLSRTFARSCVAPVWVWPPPLRCFHSIGGGLDWGRVEFLIQQKGWIRTHPPFHRGGEKRSRPALEKKKRNEGRWRWDHPVLSQSPHPRTFVGVPDSNGEVRPEEKTHTGSKVAFPHLVRNSCKIIYPMRFLATLTEVKPSAPWPNG